MKTTIEEIQARDNRTYHGNWASQSEKDRATLLVILAEVNALAEKWHDKHFHGKAYSSPKMDAADQLEAILNRTNQQGGG